MAVKATNYFAGLIACLCLGNLTTFSQSGGPDCAVAVLNKIPSLPYLSLPTETTCGMGDDYNSSNVVFCGHPTYLGGEDKVYAFDAPVSGNVQAILASSSLYASIFVYEGCPDAGTCVGAVFSSEPSPVRRMWFDVIAGRTYYVVVDQLAGSSNCITTYQLSITAPDQACPQIPTNAVNYAPNADFELGNFAGWKAYTGECCPVNTPDQAIVNGRHTIMSGNGTDPNTDNVVTMVAPGGSYSARLGNSLNGAQAERLQYSFTVDDNHNGLLYRYAVVLEDPGHGDEEQPRFEINVLDSSGNQVPCGYYKVVAGSNVPCFRSTVNGGVIYKDWTTVGADLSAYKGQEITVDFATGDCKLSGHYGYAYLDVIVTKLEIEIMGGSFCEGDTSIILTAPEGFKSYEWSTGETTQQIIINHPEDGDSVRVQLTPLQGNCNSSIFLVLKGSPKPKADFRENNACAGDTMYFTDSSSVSAGSIISRLWDFGDGTVSNLKNPEHVYNANGTYLVKLKVTSNKGCTDSIVKSVIVGGDPLTPPVLSCVAEMQGTISFHWNILQNASSYEISTDGGVTWLSNATDTFYAVNGLNSGDSSSLLLRAIGLPPCIDTVESTALTCYIPPCPVLSVTLHGDTTIADGDAAWLSATAAGGSGNYLFTWKPDIGNGPGPYAVTPDQTTIYHVTIEDQEAAGCSSASDQATVFIQGKPVIPEQECAFMFSLANAFSPNSDQLNEEFKGTGDCIKEFNMMIFNRWGEKVFVSSAIDRGWNGGVNNDPANLAPEGAYIYLVKLKDKKDKEHLYCGTVSLVK